MRELLDHLTELDKGHSVAILERFLSTIELYYTKPKANNGFWYRIDKFSLGKIRICPVAVNTLHDIVEGHGSDGHVVALLEAFSFFGLKLWVVKGFQWFANVSEIPTNGTVVRIIPKACHRFAQWYPRSDWGLLDSRVEHLEFGNENFEGVTASMAAHESDHDMFMDFGKLWYLQKNCFIDSSGNVLRYAVEFKQDAVNNDKVLRHMGQVWDGKDMRRPLREHRVVDEETLLYVPFPAIAEAPWESPRPDSTNTAVHKGKLLQSMQRAYMIRHESSKTVRLFYVPPQGHYNNLVRVALLLDIKLRNFKRKRTWQSYAATFAKLVQITRVYYDVHSGTQRAVPDDRHRNDRIAELRLLPDMLLVGQRIPVDPTFSYGFECRTNALYCLPTVPIGGSIQTAAPDGDMMSVMVLEKSPDMFVLDGKTRAMELLAWACCSGPVFVTNMKELKRAYSSLKSTRSLVKDSFEKMQALLSECQMTEDHLFGLCGVQEVTLQVAGVRGYWVVNKPNIPNCREVQALSPGLVSYGIAVCLPLQTSLDGSGHELPVKAICVVQPEYNVEVDITFINGGVYFDNEAFQEAWKHTLSYTNLDVYALEPYRAYDSPHHLLYTPAVFDSFVECDVSFASIETIKSALVDIDANTLKRVLYPDAFFQLKQTLPIRQDVLSEAKSKDLPSEAETKDVICTLSILGRDFPVAVGQPMPPLWTICPPDVWVSIMFGIWPGSPGGDSAFFDVLFDASQAPENMNDIRHRFLEWLFTFTDVAQLLAYHFLRVYKTLSHGKQPFAGDVALLRFLCDDANTVSKLTSAVLSLKVTHIRGKVVQQQLRHIFMLCTRVWKGNFYTHILADSCMDVFTGITRRMVKDVTTFHSDVEFSLCLKFRDKCLSHFDTTQSVLVEALLEVLTASGRGQAVAKLQDTIDGFRAVNMDDLADVSFRSFGIMKARIIEYVFHPIFRLLDVVEWPVLDKKRVDSLGYAVYPNVNEAMRLIAEDRKTNEYLSADLLKSDFWTFSSPPPVDLQL